MKKMMAEFKEFILRGNVIDLAVGIIIGVAFGSIINSLVNDVIMPPVGRLLGKVNFSDLFINLSGNKYASLADAKAAGAAVIAYGSFINTIINFAIIAIVLFLIIKVVNRLMRASRLKAEPAPATPTGKDCPFCYTNIPLKAVRCPNCTSQLA